MWCLKCGALMEQYGTNYYYGTIKLPDNFKTKPSKLTAPDRLRRNSMAKEKPIYRVVTQGRAVISFARVITYTPTLAALEIDMKTKWCDIIETTDYNNGNIGLFITDTERSVDVNKRKKCDTEIDFPRFKGWDIFCSSCNRYTLRVVFNKVEF